MKKLLLLFSVVFFMTACGDKEKSPDKDASDDNDATSVSDENDEFNADPDTTDDVLADEDEGDTSTDLDNDDSGDSGPDDIGAMIDIPAGPFMMGCNEAIDDKCGISTEELPYHEVTLSAYRIGKYEVTAGEYWECVKAGACNNNEDDKPHFWMNNYRSFCNLGAEGKKKYPMNCVSWNGAKAYCEWAKKRLPTEAEWEKAARGTDGRIYPWGNEYPTCEYAIMYNKETDSDGCGKNSAWVVGSREKGKSPYGAYDMAGNIFEWVNDWYAEDYYKNSPSENPNGPESGDFRVLRGGVWFNGNSHSLRTSTRIPSYLNLPDLIDKLNGFRCAE